jgi:VWFA-related protein
MGRDHLLLRSAFTGLFFLVLLCIPFRTIAQESIHLVINQVDSENFPEVKAFLTIVDATGLPIQELVKEDFTISEDTHPAAVLSLEAIEDTTHPISVVLAIDVSGSMNSKQTNAAGETITALENAKEAAISFIDSLGPSDLVGLVTFSTEATELIPLTDDKDTVKSTIEGLSAEGDTALYDAIIKSVDILKRIPAGRKAVIVLADGEDTSSEYTLQDAIGEATRWSIPIYPVGFGSVTDRPLRQIAEGTGGYLQIQPDSTQLETAFQNILRILRHQYVLTYNSGLSADNNEHSLRIGVDYMGASVEDERTFIARGKEIKVLLEGIEEGQEVGGRIRLHAIVEPSGYTRLVTFALDGKNITTLVDEPFEYIWDTSAVPDGEHTLTVTAECTAGNIGTQHLTIRVRRPVIVKWIAPVDGESISGPYTLKIEVDHVDTVTISKVEFYVDDKLIGTLTGPPYEIAWDPKGFEPGDHILRATATDIENSSLDSEIDVSLALGGSTWIFALAILILAAGAIIMISVVNRRRRRMKHIEAQKIKDKGRQESGIPPVLREIEGFEPGRQWPIGAGEIYLGRKRSEVDIPVKGLGASRQHAVIRRTNGEFILQDLNPNNPTIINGAPSGGQHRLMPGDRIEIGESVFRFGDGGEGQISANG